MVLLPPYEKPSFNWVGQGNHCLETENLFNVQYHFSKYIFQLNQPRFAVDTVEKETQRDLKVENVRSANRMNVLHAARIKQRLFSTPAFYRY